MSRSSIRAFGIACFLIGASMLLINKFGEAESESFNQTEYEQKITKLEQQLENANEQISLLEQTKELNNTNKETSTNSQVEPSKTEKKLEETKPSSNIIEATLHIYSGLTAYDIGKKLEDLGIVKNGLEMELYLAKPEYAKTIQIGQFDLNSSMSIEEIANIITGKKASSE
ncbi:MltG/YceG/YrrL family protein [Ureibacillus acetophenoni]|uniref:YceG-like family protein n=1 Tax=Ureibacillus acetophenoni TaxID=614649 RepID=A0A285U2S2_9BACL|nr:hypothetical protein [Ureibacillus acetophenoni]SOC36234.1 hypothetical protein SAMN05877842_102169 [Ureibacillus acetophenoni]